MKKVIKELEDKIEEIFCKIVYIFKLKNQKIGKKVLRNYRISLEV